MIILIPKWKLININELYIFKNKRNCFELGIIIIIITIIKSKWLSKNFIFIQNIQRIKIHTRAKYQHNYEKRIITIEKF
jgi:hypothetical protein